MTTAETVYTPLDRPPKHLRQVKPAVVLSPTEQAAYDKVLSHFKDPLLKLPVKEGEEGAKLDHELLNENEKFFLTKECIIRFLKATRFDTAACITRLTNALVWRRDWNIDNVDPDTIEIESRYGKSVIYGYSKKGQPHYIMIPAHNKTDASINQLYHTFWLIEQCQHLMGPGVEELCILIDFTGKSEKGSPNIGLSMKMLSILQNHYPNRLGDAYFKNISFGLNLFLSVMWPFIDPDTKKKIHTKGSEVLKEYTEADQILTSWGGSVNFQYDHAKFWNGLVELGQKKRAKNFAGWEKQGGEIGLSELDFKTWDD